MILIFKSEELFMAFKQLEEKKLLYHEKKLKLPEAVIQNWNQAFEIEYTHESTAIEGNTLSLIETKVILEDNISVGGKKLREIYEVVNHRNAYQFIQKKIRENKALDETIVKDIHEILMDHIIAGGFYRNVAVRITGARHTPPEPTEAYRQVKDFFADLPLKEELNPIELAAWTHAEFVRIQPFVDGNGRTSRLIMNYQLLTNEFLPISIPQSRRLEYFTALESYAVENNLSPFVEFIAALEDDQLDKYLAMASEK
jgi:Fic family protein